MTRVLNVEYAHVVGCGYDGSIVRIRHELDGEDVALMSGQNRSGETELGRGRVGLVGVDVYAVVVGTGGE